MHHPEVTDLWVTGGDPLVMKTSKLRWHLEPVLQARPAGLRTIRIGSKALSYWRFRFTHGKGADELLRFFGEIIGKGYCLALTAHFSHPVVLGGGLTLHGPIRRRPGERTSKNLSGS